MDKKTPKIGSCNSHRSGLNQKLNSNRSKSRQDFKNLQNLEGFPNANLQNEQVKKQSKVQSARGVSSNNISSQNSKHAKRDQFSIQLLTEQDSSYISDLNLQKKSKQQPQNLL